MLQERAHDPMRAPRLPTRREVRGVSSLCFHRHCCRSPKLLVSWAPYADFRLRIRRASRDRSMVEFEMFAHPFNPQGIFRRDAQRQALTFIENNALQFDLSIFDHDVECIVGRPRFYVERCRQGSLMSTSLTGAAATSGELTMKACNRLTRLIRPTSTSPFTTGSRFTWALSIRTTASSRDASGGLTVTTSRVITSPIFLPCVCVYSSAS